mgnify:FL=1
MSVDLRFEEHPLGSRGIDTARLEVEECLSRYAVYTTRVTTFDRVRRDFEDGASFYFRTVSEKDIGLIDTELHSLASHRHLPYSIEFDSGTISRKSEDL